MKGRQRFIVEHEGSRLDRFLADKLDGLSRGHVKDLIERGCVTVGGKQSKANYRLRAEEVIEIVFPGSAAGGADFERWVLHEDKHLLVLRKPAGLLMHPLGESWLSAPRAAITDKRSNLAGLLQEHRPGILDNGVERCGIVHRLDRQTSGVLLVAKTPQAYEALLEDFKERRITKLYRALVRGVPKEERARVRAPIGRNPGHRRVIVTQFGKSAETAFRLLERAAGAALVEARPLTGRTHQIRAHLAYLGHPVLGDIEFDKQRPGEPWPERMLLHAYRVELTHPGTGRKASYTAPLPADFRSFWKQLKAAR